MHTIIKEEGRINKKEECIIQQFAPPTEKYCMVPAFSTSIISNTIRSRGDEQNNGQDTSIHDSSFFWEEEEALCTSNDTTVALAECSTTKGGCEPKEKMLVAKEIFLI